MNNEPKISVVIPTYDKAQYLGEAIESVLNQTYKNIEIIIIDDGSKDNTQEVVKSFNDPRILYIWQSNQGEVVARNRGIQESNGKYIAFLDSDDLWLKEKLQKQVDFMEKSKEIGLLGTGCYEIANNGKILGQKRFSSSNNVLQKKLIKFNPFIHTSVMIRKNVFDKVSWYNKNFQESQDYELWLRIAKNYKIANLPELLVKKRYYKEGLSSAKDKQQLYFALEVKKAAIRRGQYSRWCYLYVLKSWIFMKMPFFMRKIIRKRLLKKKFYN